MCDGWRLLIRFSWSFLKIGWICSSAGDGEGVLLTGGRGRIEAIKLPSCFTNLWRRIIYCEEMGLRGLVHGVGKQLRSVPDDYRGGNGLKLEHWHSRENFWHRAYFKTRHRKSQKMKSVLFSKQPSTRGWREAFQKIETHLFPFPWSLFSILAEFFL